MTTDSMNTKSEITNLDVKEFMSRFMNKKDAVLVDVRRPDEISEGAIAGALHINFMADDFSADIQLLDKSKTYFVYCRSGRRSMGACQAMQSIGVKNLVNMDGGYLAWSEIKDNFHW